MTNLGERKPHRRRNLYVELLAIIFEVLEDWVCAHIGDSASVVENMTLNGFDVQGLVLKGIVKEGAKSELPLRL